jgi:hypothetical protein
MNNVALQAAVFFIPTQYHEMLSIRSNQLIKNEAKLYASSIATTAVRMEWANNNDSSPVELLSGGIRMYVIAQFTLIFSLATDVVALSRFIYMNLKFCCNTPSYYT